MLEHSRCHHRILYTKDRAKFTTEDGINAYVTGDLFNKCMVCGHIDFPFNTKKVIETKLAERRNNPHSKNQLYINLSIL